MRNAGSGNALDRWAGCTPNPNDAKHIVEVLCEAGATIAVPPGLRVVFGAG